MVNVKNRRQFAYELETEFYRCQHFVNVTASVVWLLKRLPLITPLANQRDYKESFPFVVDSIETFEAMPRPKKRCYEVSWTIVEIHGQFSILFFSAFPKWLRAKFISRLISKSLLFRTITWTTKQIILFARTYGYSPTPTVDAITSDNKADIELKNIIKSELLREHLQNDSISFNRPIIDWLAEAERKLEMKQYDGNECASENANATEEIVIVDDIESVENKDEHRVVRPLNDSFVTDAGKLHLPIEARFQTESSWITDVCRDVQIRLQSEEMVEGKKQFWNVIYASRTQKWW